MILLYFLVLLLLGVYSYSQIDLNLTLLQQSWFLNFQSQMISLGYFNRPVSTALFLTLTSILFGFYFFFVSKAEKLSIKELIMVIFGIVILGLFSYPAFSHDIFNYIFSGRIVIVYHTNPYNSTPLMFPGDTWTRFMQWTHVPFAWGPLYLVLLLPFYALGLGKFTLTLLSFKLMALLGYLGSIWLINKISGKKAMVFFALNPLIIYESLVAAHVDIIMLFFALLAYYLWITSKYFSSFLMLIISIGIKYATITLLPAFIFPKILKKYNLSVVNFLVVLAYLGTLGQIISRELLPHYFIVPLGFSALMSENKRLFWFGFLLSLVLLLVRYLPFLYTGQWH